MEKILPLALLFIGGTVLTAGDIIMKQWIQSDRRVYFVIGLAIYLVGLVFLAHSFKYKNIAVASIIFVIFNVVTLFIVSWLYYKETLSVTQIIGIFLGLISVTILEFAE